MKAELTRDDANVGGVQRLLCAQIEASAGRLHGKRISDRDVHDARKSLKRARATLRLMREALPTSTYRRENAALRDAARPLSALRDARILLDTLTRLEKLYGPAATHSIPAAFRGLLKREQRTIGRSSVRSPRTLCTALETVERRVNRWRLEKSGWDDIGSGLERVYRHGRHALKQARKDCAPEALHEWRKQTKYLWYQLQILEPLWPGPLGELADQAHKLSDYLGDDHDLAVLRAKVLQHADLFAPDAGPAPLLALLDRCQARLRAKAFLAGNRIYDEKPGAFTARLGRYWQRWREEGAALAA